MRDRVSHRRHEFDREIAVWMLRDASFDQNMPDAVAEVLRRFGGRKLAVSPVSVNSWNGGNIRPPMMHFERFRRLVSWALNGEGRRYHLLLIVNLSTTTRGFTLKGWWRPYLSLGGCMKTNSTRLPHPSYRN